MKPEVKPQAKPWTPFRRRGSAARRDYPTGICTPRANPSQRRGRHADTWAGWNGFFSQGPLGKKGQVAQTIEGAVWSEIEAVLKRQRYTAAPRQPGYDGPWQLLLHVDGNGISSVKDALSKANAFLDERRRPPQGAARGLKPRRSPGGPCGTALFPWLRHQTGLRPAKPPPPSAAGRHLSTSNVDRDLATNPGMTG